MKEGKTVPFSTETPCKGLHKTTMPTGDVCRLMFHLKSDELILNINT